jgi:hypothetical protein
MATTTTATKRRRGRPPGVRKATGATVIGRSGNYYADIPAHISDEWERLRPLLLTLTPFQRGLFQHALNCEFMSMGILNPVVPVRTAQSAVTASDIPAHIAGTALNSNVRATA